MIKEFKPIDKVEDPFDESVLFKILKNGGLNNALKICKKNNVSIEIYNQQFSDSAKKLLLSRRTSELLSFVYRHPDIVQIDKIEILKAAFSIGDYHSFLKNCFRFKIYIELKEQIELAITKIRKEEATSWRKKFDTMR